MMRKRKLVVSHRGALSGKYGDQGFTQVHNSLMDLASADYITGIDTEIVFLDCQESIEPHGLEALGPDATAESYKRRVDELYEIIGVDYLVIIGAQDVIPFQETPNTSGHSEDPDTIILTDLPYASEVEAGKPIDYYLKAERLVGRIPGVLGSKDVYYLINPILNVINASQYPVIAYADYFCLSSDESYGSTTNTLNALFGNNTNMIVSPPKFGNYQDDEIGRKSHIICCHGISNVPAWKGEDNEILSDCIHVCDFAGRVTKGTVVACQCCYGAELYDAPGGICNEMIQDAIAFFGSTSTSFGGTSKPAHADIICRYFMQNVLSGASIGEALKLARISYYNDFGKGLTTGISGIGIKTLAQFYLLGDPSVIPVKQPTFSPIVSQPPSRHSPRHPEKIILPPRTIRPLEEMGFKDIELQKEIVDYSIPDDILRQLEQREKELRMENVERKTFTIGSRKKDPSAYSFLSSGIVNKGGDPRTSVLIEAFQEDGKLKMKTIVRR